jgi:hypothetical protein
MTHALDLCITELRHMPLNTVRSDIKDISDCFVSLYNHVSLTLFSVYLMRSQRYFTLPSYLMETPAQLSLLSPVSQFEVEVP